MNKTKLDPDEQGILDAFEAGEFESQLDDERIQLMKDVWHRIAEDQQKLELTQAQREELDRRLNAYERDGQSGRDAGTVLEGIRRRL